MKRKFLTIILLLITVFAVASVFVGCGKRAETAEELIPTAEEMGEPEGLWLYKGESRSRTDGSERESLFDNININDDAYSSEQFSVEDYVYLTDVHKAVFLLTLEDNCYCLYIYDYEHKAGEYLCDAPSDTVKFSVTDNYFYALFEETGLLFDRDMNMLCDSIAGALENDVLYSVRYSDVTTFKWYYNGLHSVEMSRGNPAWEVEIYGNYVYFIAGNEPQYAVNRVTEEVTEFTVFDVENDSSKYVESRRHVEDRFYYDGAMYVFSVVYCIIDYGDQDHEEKDEWYWYLHRIYGDVATLEHSFGEVRRGMSVGEYKGKFYFEARTLGNLYQTHYRYDPETGKTKWIPVFSYHSGSIPSRPIKSTVTKPNRISVGEYEFYVTSSAYGYGGFLGEPLGYCNYLRRKHGDERKIMQYSFSGSYFFDDICEF